MLRRSASASNTDQSGAPGPHVEEPEQAALRAVVAVDPSLDGYHAALASLVQLTPISG
jgi:hypothetical protein